MQGTIAQIVALTAHGNSILQGATDSQSLDFQTLNSTFMFCESVQFFHLVRGVLTRKEKVYATNTHDWFERLKEEGVYALRMSYGSSPGNKIVDRMLVGFVAGGGKWLIETCGPDRPDFWESRWQVGNRHSVDKKIWRLAYIRVAGGTPAYRDEPENLEKLKDEMRENLQEITQFSRSHNLDWFTKAFESGLSRLESRTPFGRSLPQRHCTRRFPTELSRVRTELHRRRIFAGVSPHPVQADSQPAPHRYLGNALVPTHRQVNVPTPPGWVATRSCLSSLHQQEAQQGAALLG
jgi:hypothetical protein